MIRDLMLLPGVPRRLLDDIGDIRRLVRELRDTAGELTRTAKAMDSKIAATNDRLDSALEELRSLNGRIDRLDRRIEHVEQELVVMRGGVEEIAEVAPKLGKGPLEKAKDALGG